MDTKRMIIAVVLTTIFIVGYLQFLKYQYRKHPEWAAQTQPAATAPATTEATATSGPTTSSGGGAAATTAVMSPGKGFAVISSTQPAAPVTLGSKLKNDPNYALGLELSANEAGIDAVTLNQFNERTGSKEPYSYQQPFGANVDQSQTLGTTRLVINNVPVDLSGVKWNAEPAAVGSASFSLNVTDGHGRALLIEKTYTVKPRSADAKSPQGYLVSADYRLTNLTTQPAEPLEVSVDFTGPIEPPSEVERGPDRQVIAGYNNSGQVVIGSHTVDEFKPGSESKEITKSDKGQPMLWAGACSTYFLAIVQPGDPAQIQSITARALNPEAEPVDRQVVLDFHSAPIKIEPGKSADLPLQIFFGPRQRELLDTTFFSDFPRQYDLSLVITTSWCGFCAFPWLITLLVKLLWVFHLVLHDWGLAIIALVVLVRVLLHPITKRSQVSMMKMTKMAPEMERLKKKFGDDSAGLQKAQMELYKNVGFTPILGCLPMFLQMPIWIALYTALQSEFALRQEPFLWGFTWIKDLAKPDAIYRFAQPIPLYFFGWHLAAINILPMLIGVVTFISQKYQPQPVAVTPEQIQQQKMMRYMSLIIPLAFYAAPSGLNLYYVTSMSLGIIESKRIRAHIKQKEEEEKAGKVIIDAKPTRGKKKISDEDSDVAKPTGIAGWIARLQEKAEQVRRDSQRKGDKKA